MADVGYGPVPTNQILVAGQPLIQILKVQTATNMYAGRLVKKGTNDDDIVVNTSGGDCIGWLGYEQTIKKYRPSTVDTIYAGDEQAAVLHGGGFVLVASAAAGISVSKGDRLAGVGAGQVSGGSVSATVGYVAIAEESKSSSSACDIMVRSLI